MENDNDPKESLQATIQQLEAVFLQFLQDVQVMADRLNAWMRENNLTLDDDGQLRVTTPNESPHANHDPHRKHWESPRWQPPRRR